MEPSSNLPEGFQEFSRETEKKYTLKSMRLTIDVNRHFRFRLDSTALREMKLQKENYVKFFRFNKDWFIVKAQSGYLISVDTRAGCSFSTAITAQNILKDFETKGKFIEFFLSPTEHVLDGFPLYQLNLMHDKQR